MVSGKDKLRKKIGGRRSTRQMYADKRSDQPIELDTLRLDGGTQPREAYDEQVLGEYADRMEIDDRGFVVDPQGQAWEPIVLYDDDEHLWLADGFHRVRAARSKGLKTFQARIIVGNQRDAVKYSLSANARHGLRRTSADKRRAVQRALTDDEWGAYSARALAELCSVSDFLVRQVRQHLEESGEVEAPTQIVGADGKVHDVSTRTVEKKRSKKTSSSSKKSTSKRASKAKIALSDREALSSGLDASSTSFEQLDSAHELDAVACVIAYPERAVHFDAMCDHLGRLLREDGALIIPLAQGHEALAGAAALGRLVERGQLSAPRWVAIQDTRQVALVWARHEDLPTWTHDLQALIDALDPESTQLLV